MIKGGCFCGTIRYEVSGNLVDARSCHCSQCRKIFSGAGSAYAELSGDADFLWVSGRDSLKIYASAGDWGISFCSNCGSTLAGMYKDKVHGLTLGSVDGDPGVEIMKHIFVGSKAPWDHIGGNAPQYDEHADV
jgi:hypothetical protein